MQSSFRFSDAYMHLEAGGRAVAMPVTPEFWPTLMSGEGNDKGARYLREAAPGWLVTMFRMEQNPPGCEMHPSGDELLTMLSGRLTVILEESTGLRRITLDAGKTCVVPKGIWHSFDVETPGDLLALTYGAGTRHRPA